MVMLDRNRLAEFIGSKGEAIFHNADDGHYVVVYQTGGARTYVGPFTSSRQAIQWRDNNCPDGSVIPLTSPLSI